MSDTQPNDWNPRDESIVGDQRRAYDEMRERCPVAHSEFMGWSLFRHADILAVLADPATYSNASRFLAIPNGMDPPVHRRYREALAVFFDRDQMDGLEPRARDVAVNLLVPTLANGEIDVVHAFATPFVLKTLCAWLGWPEQQWECLGGWIHGNQEAAFSRNHAAGAALAGLFSEHVKTNLGAHRAAHDDVVDVTDALLRTEVDGKRLDDDEIVSILRNWTAGQGTVAAGIGILIMHLAQDVALQERLRRNPSLIPAAIEEILRADDPLVANRRVTTRDVEIQGRTIPGGEPLTLVWIAANRDPRAFDDPSAVDIERRLHDGMVWGQGIHVCLGAPLARLEMRVALEELLSRTTRCELAGAPRRAVYPSNGLEAFTVRVS
jgi:cytochrome P450